MVPVVLLGQTWGFICYDVDPVQLLIAKCIGVNISERKSGTEWTKKRKKRELVFCPPPGGATGTVVHRLDTTLILPELR